MSEFDTMICGHRSGGNLGTYCSECMRLQDAENNRVHIANMHLKTALRQIAGGKLPDGSWKLDRRACRTLAIETIDRVEQHSENV